MKKGYFIICVLGFLFACTSPIERVYNQENVLNDLREIENSIEPSDFKLLESTLRRESENPEFKNKLYLQILDSLKMVVHKEKQIQLEREQLAFEQPLQISNTTDNGFERFNFQIMGNEKKTVGYRLKGSFINISDKTFVKVEFNDPDVYFWADAKKTPHVEVSLNDTLRLACVNFGDSFGNWSKTENIKLPSASFENPWRPNETKNFEMYFQPDVTCGYYIGIDDYGDLLQPVHFKYEPNSCIVKIPIYVEDANGYKKQMLLSLDIMDDFKSFASENPNANDQP